MTTMHYRSVTAAISPNNMDAREFEGVAATSTLQDDGLALVMAGGDVSRLRNGPLLLGHDLSKGVFARIVSARTTGDSLPIRARFATAGISQQIDTICQLVKDGIYTALSLGFGVDEAEWVNPLQPALGRRVTKWTAFEVSLVAVPMDAEAVITARQHRMAGSTRGLTHTEQRLLTAAADLDVALSRTRMLDLIAEATRCGRDPVQWLRFTTTRLRG